MLCQECKKRKTCKSLCKKAEKYANQDHVTLKELIPDKPIVYAAPFPNQSTRSNEEIIISMFFTGGKKQVYIADILNVSKQYVNKIIAKHRLIIGKNIRKSG